MNPNPSTNAEKSTGTRRPSDDDGETKLQSEPPVEEIQTPRYSVLTEWQKRGVVLGACLMAFFSPLTAQIYLPALTSISKDLNITSSEVNLTVTTYMVFQGIVPMFMCSLADSGGRRPAYVICFVVYTAANIGLALAPNYAALLSLRCLQSAGSSSTISLASAVMADIVTSAERGNYIGYVVVPGVLGTSIGPIIGGLLSQYLGWRSIFWFLTILSGASFVLFGLFFPETCRHIVGDGSITPPLIYQNLLQMLRRRRRRQQREQSGLDRQLSRMSEMEDSFKFKMPNILGSLFMLFEKETGILMGSSSIALAVYYCMATAMPMLLERDYGFDEVTVGLMYLPTAFGSVIGAVVMGPLLTRNYKRHCAKLGIPFERTRQQDISGFPIERVRMEIGLPMLGLGGLGFIAWGWVMEAKAHVAVVCIVAFVAVVGMIIFHNSVNALLVDIHPGKAGTATAAGNLTRCIVGAGATAAIAPMIDAIGVGWAFTIVGGLCIVCMLPVAALNFWGMGWRAKRDEKMRVKEVASEANAEGNGQLEGNGDIIDERKDKE